jgi:hypothetical protein
MNKNPRPPGLAAALAGWVFCLAMIGGGDEFLCVTGGCAVTTDITFFGISLWWIGSAGLAALAALILTGRTAWAIGLAGLETLADAGLKAFMALGPPCLSCLLAGLFFPVVFWALARTFAEHRRRAMVVVIIWGLCFSPNVFGLASEGIGPWPVWGPARAGTQVYFSPTCPACQATLNFFRPYAEGGEKTVAFFPVAKSDEDRLWVERLAESLDRGQTWSQAQAAAGQSDSNGPPSWGIRLRVRLGLWRNQTALHRIGSGEAPMVVITGGMGSPPSPASGAP